MLDPMTAILLPPPAPDVDRRPAALAAGDLVMLVVNHHNVVRATNPAADALLGRDHISLLGTHIEHLVRVPGGRSLGDLLHEARCGIPWSGAVDLVRWGSEVARLDASLSVLSGPGGNVAIVGVHVDLAA